MERKIVVSKSLKRLKPKEFQKWFKGRELEGDWEKEYKKIGGKIEAPGRSEKST
jgi:hypothetical protein